MHTLFQRLKHATRKVFALVCLVVVSAPLLAQELPLKKQPSPNASPSPAPLSPALPPTDGRASPSSPESADPSSPAERARLLQNLYAYLATADGEERATSIANAVERLWLWSDSDTIAVLMNRALGAANSRNFDLALKLLDAVVDLAPDYAEGWNRRAYVYYMRGDMEHALGDLRRVLALEPNHFKALDGLGSIMNSLGEKKAALEAYRRLLAVHPYWPGAKDAVDLLKQQIDGQGI